jgi:hypothetical protein
MKHSNTSFNKSPSHLHSMRKTSKTHISISHNRGQEIPIIQSFPFFLGVKKTELTLALILPLLRAEDLVYDSWYGVPWVICVVHSWLADFGIAA